MADEIKKFDIVELYLNDVKGAPTNGQSQYIVIGLDKKQVTLLHPSTLTKFSMGIGDLEASLQAVSTSDPAKMATTLEKQLKFFKSMKKHKRSQASGDEVLEVANTLRQLPLTVDGAGIP